MFPSEISSIALNYNQAHSMPNSAYFFSLQELSK